MKFATKPIWHYPPHLRHVATLPWNDLELAVEVMWRHRICHQSSRAVWLPVYIHHGPWTRVLFLTPVFTAVDTAVNTAREHG